MFMESATKNFETSLLEEDANLSAFRKRNNILVLILICFIVILTLIIGLSIYYVLHNIPEPDQPILLNPAVLEYCSVSCNTSSCLNIFFPIISTKITNPNQIFTLSLQTAAEELKNLTSFMLSNSNTEPAFKNCSDSLLVGSGQIRAALGTMRVNPFVERLSKELRSEMLNRIMTADDNLESCLDDLGKYVGSTAVREVREKVLRVKVYLCGGGNFLLMYGIVLENFNASRDPRSMIFENVVIVSVCGLYLWFIFYFFRALCRFLGVKPLLLGNAFRAWLAGTAVSGE